MRSYNINLGKIINVCINAHTYRNEALSWRSHKNENSLKAAFMSGLGRWITKINEQKYI